MGKWDYTKPPSNSDGKAYIRTIDGVRWIFCPFCGKRQFPIKENTVIKNFDYVCKGSKCKKTMKIHISNIFL